LEPRPGFDAGPSRHKAVAPLSMVGVLVIETATMVVALDLIALIETRRHVLR
jgi:hypothetical protein